MKLRIALLAAMVLGAARSGAQTAAEHIAMGDRERAAMNASAALHHYQEAIAVDSANAEALWRASREAVDLGEFNDAGRDSLYRIGEAYARRAVRANPRSAMAHFALAKALGRRALSLGARDRVKYAGEVRQEALAALALDSANAGALHVMAMWHANIMRLNGFTRFLARNVLGGKTFGEANWNDAQRLLERAVEIEPDRVVHRLDLGQVYTDRGEIAKARATYETALRLKPLEYNDPNYQRQVRELLGKLR